MNLRDEWGQWLLDNDGTIEITAESRGGQMTKERMWLWSMKRMEGLSVPLDTTPAELPALLEARGKAMIRHAEDQAGRERERGERFLQWCREAANPPGKD